GGEQSPSATSLPRGTGGASRRGWIVFLGAGWGGVSFQGTVAALPVKLTSATSPFAFRLGFFFFGTMGPRSAPPETAPGTGPIAARSGAGARGPGPPTPDMVDREIDRVPGGQKGPALEDEAVELEERFGECERDQGRRRLLEGEPSQRD